MYIHLEYRPLDRRARSSQTTQGSAPRPRQEGGWDGMDQNSSERPLKKVG